MLLSQGAIHLNDPRLTNPTYLKILQVPIFQMTLSGYYEGHSQVKFELSGCRRYGYAGSSMIICVKDLIHNQNNTSVLIGEQPVHVLGADE
jgi:hypothetical protein